MDRDMNDRLFSIEGKRCLITGANRGIGRTIAKALAERGARLTLLVRAPDDATLDYLASRTGSRPETVIGDLSDPEAFSRIVEHKIADRQFDVLINNAGIFRSDPAESVRVADWDRVMDTNLNSAWRLSQAVGSGMLERGAGKIISIASLMSFQGGRNVVS